MGNVLHIACRKGKMISLIKLKVDMKLLFTV